MSDQSFTPALGRLGSVGFYDRAIRLLTREQVWRAALLRQVAPEAGEIILDVGCGTGTFAIMLKRLCPGARIVALDPDPGVLKIASRKGMEAGVVIDWRQGFATDAEALGGTVDKVVSSLVFHQVPVTGKGEGIAAMFAAVRPGGEVHIADYASQRGIMRALFRLTVQQIDGLVDTQPNADGAIEAILSDRSGTPIEATRAIPTPTGAISLFKAEQTASV